MLISIFGIISGLFGTAADFAGAYASATDVIAAITEFLGGFIAA